MRPKNDKLDQVTYDELDEDLKELAATQLYSTTALLAIQQTRLLRSIDKGIVWINNEGVSTWTRRE